MARLDSPTGSLLLYATAPSKTAADGEGENGVFTGSLIKQLRQPGLSLSEIVLKTRVDVMRETQNEQVPWSSSSLTREVVLLSDEDFSASQPNTDVSTSVESNSSDAPTNQNSSLLQACNAHLAANRLTAGAGGSALDCFKSVLTNDPYSLEAITGIDKITDIYIGRARSALEMSRAKSVERYLDTILEINPEHPAIEELEFGLERIALAQIASNAENESGAPEQNIQNPSDPLVDNEFQESEIEEVQSENDSELQPLEIAAVDSKTVESIDNSLEEEPAPESLQLEEEDYSVDEAKIEEPALPVDEETDNSRSVETVIETETDPEVESETVEQEDYTIALAKTAPPRVLCPDCIATKHADGSPCVKLSPQPSVFVPSTEGNCAAINLGQCVDNEYRFKIENSCKKPMYVEWVFNKNEGPFFDSTVLVKSEEKVITCLKQTEGCNGKIRYSWKKNSK